MCVTITNCWKIFRYGVLRYHYTILIDIREIQERLSLDWFNNNCTTDTKTPENIHLIDEVDDRETVYTYRNLHFTGASSFFTQGRTIYDLTLNNTSSSASTFVDSNIGSQHTSEKEGAK